MNITDDELRRIAEGDIPEGAGVGWTDIYAIARELLDARAQLSRLMGNALVAEFGEEDRKMLRRLHPAKIEHPTQALVNKALDALESCEHRLAATQAVLLDRRLDDGAEQLREACARAAVDWLHNKMPPNLGLREVVESVPITGAVSDSDSAALRDIVVNSAQTQRPIWDGPRLVGHERGEMRVTLTGSSAAATKWLNGLVDRIATAQGRDTGEAE